MVGSMLAAALGRLQWRVLVVESALPEAFVADSPYDLRVSALSIASEHMLQVVGAWDGIVGRRATPFRRMKVWDGEQGGVTEFNSAESDEEHLGNIVENRVIQLALHDVLESLPSVELCSPASLSDIDVATGQVNVSLDDGQVITAKLVVGADGARSRVRELAGIAVSQSRYPQEALVASVQTALPQQDITWQRFLPSGPQAFLPLNGHRASMVWYHSSDEVARLKALPEDEFLAEMQATFPAETGQLEQVFARGSFPLFRSHAEHYVKHRIALIGDAAHTVHPLAGQGVNLGLLDAAVLAETLTDSRAGSDIGTLSQLRPYQRWRRTENGLMINVLDGFYQAFKPQSTAVQKIRSAALDLAGRASPLRRLVMQHAMGVKGDLPRLARGFELTDG